MEQFKKALRDKKLKETPQRLAVHQAMMALVHASADMVVAYVAEHSDVKLTTASVYNTLSLLADNKIYGRRMSSNNKMYFDVVGTRHIHIYDSVNHEYQNVINEKVISEIEAFLKGRRYKGYSIDDIDVQIVCHPTKRRKK